MSTNRVELHRVLTAAPLRVYRAFLEPQAMAKWLPPRPPVPITPIPSRSLAELVWA